VTEVWVARLRPPPGQDVDALLAGSHGLDVWERAADHLLVAAAENQLAELERRGLAQVERLDTRAEFIRRSARGRPPDLDGDHEQRAGPGTGR
jgi:hypothetical protein